MSQRGLNALENEVCLFINGFRNSLFRHALTLHCPQTLFQCLIDGLITNKNTWANGSFFQNIPWKSQSALASIEELTANEMFKDIGRLCRAIGKIIDTSLQVQVKTKSTKPAEYITQGIER